MSAINLAAVVAGSASFWSFFHHGEHFDSGTLYLKLFSILVISGSIGLNHYTSMSFFSALGVSLRILFYFLVGVYSNCLFFRIFLNPLNKFPGPWLARVTKFDHVIRNKAFNGHQVLLELHNKYGKFVRIGPNDLSCIDSAGTPVLLGPQTKCTKAHWYSNDAPRTSMHTTRDKAMHDRRRRIWAPAFSDKALRGYETRLQTYNDQLVEQLDKNDGKVLNATNLLNLYSFDAMGDLAFGESFHALPAGEMHWAIQLLSEGMDPLALGLPGWTFRLLLAIPGLTAGFYRFFDFTTAQLQKRIDAHDEFKKKDAGGDRKDIVHTLIEHYNASDDKAQLWPLLEGDSRLIIVAGSDTTAATLSHLFYHMASKPEWQTKVRAEIQSLKAKSSDHTLHDNTIKDAPILNGMINETLRLNPPVPSGVFRSTPPEGVNIGSTFVPGYTTVQMPMYVMSRSEDNYVQPNEFLPLRWSSDSNQVKKQDAFVPFSTGPFGCIGKNLALMEIRTVTAQIIDQFDVKLAPGEDGHRLLMQTTDHFTLGLKPLDLIFTRRT